jgi:hypothetical protein
MCDCVSVSLSVSVTVAVSVSVGVCLCLCVRRTCTPVKFFLYSQCFDVLQELLTCLEAAAEAGGGRLQWPDKRSQKREIAAHTAVLANALDNCQEPPAALSLIVPLLVTKVSPVHIPGSKLTLFCLTLCPQIELAAVKASALSDAGTKHPGCLIDEKIEGLRKGRPRSSSKRAHLNLLQPYILMTW